uniref:Uncharacterized protein n=1 Tax=Paramoeba aestuarina TaxID=180227 RepID=A0A7S4PAH5_9EUKA|mmetsp:Transcript_38667/g.61279  ORF Transcript_38667/g.61279 Transcript_38667/m.61279 type:complete len:103 (+) Transcript_38667:51-359(+)
MREWFSFLVSKALKGLVHIPSFLLRSSSFSLLFPPLVKAEKERYLMPSAGDCRALFGGSWGLNNFRTQQQPKKQCHCGFDIIFVLFFVVFTNQTLADLFFLE